MLYVDAGRLEQLAEAPLSEETKARIVQAVGQGYGVMVQERTVTLDGEQNATQACMHKRGI